MKAVLAAPQDGHTNVYVARALERAGLQVHQYDYRRRGILIGSKAMNEELRKVAAGADLLLVLKGEAVWPTTYRILSRGGTRTAMWFFDPRDGKQRWVEDMALNAGYFFTIAKGHVQHYRALGVDAHWLLEAADPEAHSAAELLEDRRDVPVGFIGTIDGIEDRVRWLSAVKSRFQGQLHLWGSFPGPMTENHHGRADGDATMAAVVARTKVNLGRDRNPEVERSYGARLFRTLCAGGFLLTNDTLGIDEDFAGCLATYRSTDHCVDQIQWWLDHPSERLRVATLGRAEVLAKHTWGHRIDELLGVVGLG